MRDLIFFSLFMAAAALSLRQAHLGLMLWIWSALFPPNEYLFGFAQGIPFNKLSVLCTLIGLVADRKRRMVKDPILTFMLLFVISVTISQVSATTPPDFGEELYERFVKGVIAALVIPIVATDRLRLYSLILAMCLAVGTGAVDEGLKFLLSGGSHHSKGPASWGDENITATIILIVLPLLHYVIGYANNPHFRKILMGVLAMSIITVIGTFSRGGFLGLLLWSGTFLIHSKNRGLALVLIIGGLVAGLALAPDSWFDRIHSTTNAEQDDSFMGRVVQWKILTLMALDHPLFGMGTLANLYPPIWYSYAPRLTLEFTGIPTPPPTHPFASHSIYFQVLGENGFIGLACYIALLTQGMLAGRSIRSLIGHRPEMKWAADLSRTLTVCLMLFAVTGAALPIPYLEFNLMILGSLAALRQICKDHMASAQKSALLARRNAVAARQRDQVSAAESEFFEPGR